MRRPCTRYPSQSLQKKRLLPRQSRAPGISGNRWVRPVARSTRCARYSIATYGERPAWQPRWDAWLDEYRIPVRRDRVRALHHRAGAVSRVVFDSGDGVPAEAVFVTRGDVVHAGLAERLGARKDDAGQVVVDAEMRTSVPGLYAAGCVTPANCQMIIAAGQGATAAQVINRDLFEDSLARHALRVCAPAT